MVNEEYAPIFSDMVVLLFAGAIIIVLLFPLLGIKNVLDYLFYWGGIWVILTFIWAYIDETRKQKKFVRIKIK